MFINKNFTWGGDVYKQYILLGEGTFIKIKFTWGGDVYKQKFFLGRGC